MPEDIVTLLTNDHEEARQLLKKLENAEGDEATRLFEKLREEMVKHSRAEEELVYPFYKECIGSTSAKVNVVESKAEHENIDKLIDEILALRPGSVEYKGRLKFLKESIEHHAGDEEKDMFPEMRRSCPPDQLQDLAQQVRNRKKEIQVPSGGGRSGSGSRKTGDTGKTRDELYEQAKKQDIEGRSEMTKKELQDALKRDH